MTKNEAINAIKNATKAIGLLFQSDEKFEAVKVKDGSQDVSIEGEYAVGSKVSVSSSTGSIAAPDGDYTLSDGKSFSTKGGAISNVNDADGDNDADEKFSEAEEAKSEDKTGDVISEEVVAESNEEAKAEEVKSEEAKPEENSEMKELADKVKGLEEAFNKLKEAFATKEDLKVIGDNFSTIKSAFEVLSDTPAEFSKVDKSVEAKEEKAKKLEALAAIMGKK